MTSNPSWDTTLDMFEDGHHDHTSTIQNDGIAQSQIDDEINNPEQLLAYAELVQINDDRRINHALFNNIPNIEQGLYFDFSKPLINGIQYDAPLFLPLFNAQSELKQVAILELDKRTTITPNHKPQAFARFGEFKTDQPIIIAYDLESAFRLVNCGYCVALAIFNETLNINIKTELNQVQCNLIKSVCNQLSKAGYQQLYMVSYPDAYPKLHTPLVAALAANNVHFIDCELHISFMDEDELKSLIGDVTSNQDIDDTTDDTIYRLATMDELLYEQTRSAEAESLGIRASMLDRLVKAKRKELSEQQNEDDFFEHIEPWHSVVDGHELLNSIHTVIHNHIACENHTAITATLWTVFTWAIDAMQIAPIACITAPEKRCGKTQLLTLIGELCYKPLPTSNITAAALYRSIEDWKPTLLIDEADTFLKDNEDLRGVINAGHSRKNAFVIRCEGDDNKPKRFNVWCAKAISGIGQLPETIKDRSIILELRRKLPNEHKQRLRHADPHQWHTIKRKCLRWVNDNLEPIKSIRPNLPEALNDRAQDNWESLFIIAQLASPEWLEKANQAAITINGVEVDTPSINEQLLFDIKQIFEQHDYKNIFSIGLIEALTKDEESTWFTWNRGKPITQHQLSSRLKQFGIKSKDVRIGTVVKRGFEIEQFKDAFKRYLPITPFQSATTLQPIQDKACSQFKSATRNNNVAFKNSSKALVDKTCSDVAFQNPTTGDTTVNTTAAAEKRTVKKQQNDKTEISPQYGFEEF